MQAVMGFISLAACAALLRFTAPGARRAARIPLRSEAAATSTIMLVTILGSLGLLLVLFWLTGIDLAGA